MKSKRIVFLAIVGALVLWTAQPALAGQPGDWSYKVAHGASLAAFPTNYVMDFGVADQGSYRINYTYGGTGSVTVVFQGSVDNATWVTIGTPVNASSSSVEVQRIAVSLDGAGTTTSTLSFPHYRLRFTASGGSPSLTDLHIYLYRKGGTVDR